MEFRYKGLTATLERVPVTETEIDRRLEQLRAQTPCITEITDRPAALGDEVILDYAGSCDGVPFPGGTAQNQALTLGSGMFIPGFEDQLVGARVGDTVTVHVTFPEVYHAKELAGKLANFACVIHKIHARTAYELDDRFAREVGRCPDLKTLRKAVSKSLRAYYDDRSQQELKDTLLRQAAATLPFAPTEEQMQEAVTRQLETMKTQLAQRSLTLEDYCRFSGTTEAQLRADLEPDARQALQNEAAVREIALREKLTPDAGRLDAAWLMVAKKNHMTPEALRQYADESLKEAISFSVQWQMVLDFLVQNSTVTEVWLETE